MLKLIFLFLSIGATALFATPLTADIAFVANLDGNWDLFTADDQGRNCVRVTRTVLDERDPDWFPDGERILYSTSDGSINQVSIDSGKQSRVVRNEANRPLITPSVSPDGSKIILSRFRPPDEADDTDLIVYDLDTRQSTRLLDQPAIQMWPSWSPDGTRIAYANVHCSSECGRIIQELWVADSRGRWARQLLLTHGFNQQPVWSPDGRRIAFASDHKGNHDIWIVNLDNWRLSQATTHKALDVGPAWSPDGRRLAFVSTRSGSMEIWVKDLKSGALERLRPFGDRKVECKDVAW